MADTAIARPKYVSEGNTELLVAETIAWVVILGHVIHWAVDAAYYIVTQVSYMTQAKHGQVITIIGSNPPGDWWDRLTVHTANILGLHNSILNNNGAAAPFWWVTWRHDIRDVYIGVIAGVAVFFLTSKPRAERKDYTWYRLAATPVLALVYAIPGIALGGIAVWKIHWLRGGLNPPASWGAVGNEVGQWTGTGKLALILLGLLGSWAFARFASIGPADEMQWAYAERKANKIQHERTGTLAAVGNLKDSIVIGPPGYRRRVHWLVDHRLVTEAKGTGTTVVLWAFMAITFILAGYGAWLTLAGPAANA